jgi:hypothetical protein
MYDRIEICRRITEVLPELGVCGFDINVTHDDALKAWRVNYDDEGQRALTFLDDADVERCLEGNECLSLGLMIHQQMGSGVSAELPQAA